MVLNLSKRHKKEHHTFEFMILSGYQEFDYLKERMQLGCGQLPDEASQ